MRLTFVPDWRYDARKIQSACLSPIHPSIHSFIHFFVAYSLFFFLANSIFFVQLIVDIPAFIQAILFLVTVTVL